MCVHISQNCVFIQIWSSLNETGERLTKCQEQVLMTMFQANAYPGTEEICQAASTLNTSIVRIEHLLCMLRDKKRAERVLLEGE